MSCHWIFMNIISNNKNQKCFRDYCEQQRKGSRMAFTFAAFTYIVALIIDAFLIFFAIFHVSLAKINQLDFFMILLLYLTVCRLQRRVRMVDSKSIKSEEIVHILKSWGKLYLFCKLLYYFG